jgi:hypothetical protein
MKNRYKIAIIVIIILLRAPSLFSEEPKQSDTFLGLTQENKVYAYMLSALATSWGIYKNAITAGLPVDYLEQKGIRVENPLWKPTEAYAKLANELDVPESTAKELMKGLRSRQIAKGGGWGGAAFFALLAGLDYYGYLPHTNENQQKFLPEKPTASIQNQKNQTASAE